VTLRGSLSSFPLETIVQLIAATAKTGQLEIRSGGESGTLGFADGRLVSALSGDDTSDPALGAVFALADGEFEFVPWGDPPDANLTGDLNQLLDRAVVQRDRIVADRELIPDDRMGFALSDRAAANGEVRLSAEQWRILLAVNGERDLGAIAEQIRLGKLVTLAVLADLVRSGIVSATPPPPEPQAEPAAPPVTELDEQPAAQAPDDERAAPSPSVEPPDADIDIRPVPPALPLPGSVVPAESPPQPVDVAAGGPRKRGLFSGLFKRDEEAPHETANVGLGHLGQKGGTRVVQLAALANGLLDEFKNGENGTGGLDDRIADRLMRADVQADPIDRPLPVVNDRIDAAALGRADMPDAQVAPYLALLVSQIYEDAERAFGRDKARRGYRSVQQRAIADAASLGTDLRLPKA